MTVTNRAETILSLLRDPKFSDLRRRADQKALLWNDFKHMAMPEGYTAEETWAITTILRKQISLSLPIHSYVYPEGSGEVWYLINQAMASTINAVESFAHLDLDRKYLLKSEMGRYFFASRLALDLSYAMKRDGISVSEEHILSIILEQRSPQSPEDTLIKNAAALTMEIPKYAKRRLTTWILEDIVERLSEGCESLESRNIYRLFETPDIVVRYANATPEEIQEDICMIVNRDYADRLSSPLIELVLMSNYFWDLVPLRKWNGVVELIVRHLMLVKTDYPLVRWVPLSYINHQWEKGEIAPPEVCCKLSDYDPDIGEGLDCTPSSHAQIELILIGLRQLLHDAEEKKRSEEPFIQAIRAIAGISHRQKDILKSVIANPELSLRIDPHKRIYGVAYGTARSDFLKLVDAGLLDQDYDGRAMVFRKSEHFADKLEEYSRKGSVFSDLGQSG